MAEEINTAASVIIIIATWAVTSEDEWYKAAYYKGGGIDAGYWDYPTQSNTPPSNILGNPTDPGNNATHFNSDHHWYTIGGPYHRTEVGAHENSDSAYGTFDQGGNVWEWNEAIISSGSDYAYRGMRGGAYIYNRLQHSYYRLRASNRNIGGYYPIYEDNGFGFRVTEIPTTAVPEPSSLLLASSALLPAGFIFRRKSGLMKKP